MSVFDTKRATNVQARPAPAAPFTRPGTVPTAYQEPQAPPPRVAASPGGSIFNGIEHATISFNASYIREGHYLMQVRKVEQGLTRKKEAFLAINLRTLHVFDNGGGRGNRPGEEPTHMTMPKWDTFLGTVKQFVSVALACEPEEVDMASCDEMTGPGQPMSGHILEVIAKDITTKKGANFTRVTYVRPWTGYETLNAMTEEERAYLLPGEIADLEQDR